jgi:hypothetical protein
MVLPLKIIPALLGHVDIAALRSLVATSEQQHDAVSQAAKVNSVAGTVVDPQFVHSTP